MRIVIEKRIQSSPDRLWQCLIDPAARRAWFGPHLQLDAQLGGELREVWRDGVRQVVTSGRVTAFEPGRRMVLSWKDEDWPDETEVEISIEADPTGAVIRLSHGGWERLGGGSAALADAHRSGWNMHLANLADFAEGDG